MSNSVMKLDDQIYFLGNHFACVVEGQPKAHQPDDRLEVAQAIVSNMMACLDSGEVSLSNPESVTKAYKAVASVLNRSMDILEASDCSAGAADYIERTRATARQFAV